MSPTTLYGNIGEAPCTPTLTSPQYCCGSKHQDTTYDCSPTTTVYAGISYTVDPVQWDPPIPSKFGILNSPQFQSTAYVNVWSGDPLCPDPGRVNLGTCTWSISGIPTTTTITIDGSALSKFTGLMGSVMQGACTGGLDPSKITISFSETDTPIACDCVNGPVKTKVKMQGSGTQSFGSFQCDWPFLGVPYVASVNVTVGGSLGLQYSINGEGNPCNGHFTICGSVTLQGSANGGISAIIGSRKIIYVSGTIQFSVSGGGQICYDSDTGNIKGTAKGCSDKVDLVGKVVLFGGFSASYTANIAGPICTPDIQF